MKSLGKRIQSFGFHCSMLIYPFSLSLASIKASGGSNILEVEFGGGDCLALPSLKPNADKIEVLYVIGRGCCAFMIEYCPPLKHGVVQRCF